MGKAYSEEKNRNKETLMGRGYNAYQQAIIFRLEGGGI